MASGRKDDKGKLRFDLVPAIILKALAQVFTFGAEKYEDNSWQGLEDFKNRYLAAAHRHLSDHQLGELRDKESGLYHLDHALWNIAALRWKLEQSETCVDCGALIPNDPWSSWKAEDFFNHPDCKWHVLPSGEQVLAVGEVIADSDCPSCTEEEEEVATIEFILNEDFEIDQENIHKFFKGHKNTLTFTHNPETLPKVQPRYSYTKKCPYQFGEGHPEAVTMEGIPKDDGFMTVHDDVDTET